MPARSEVFIPPGVLLVRNQRAGETAQLRRDAVALVTDDCEHGIEPCGKGRLHRAAHERPAIELDEHLVLAHAAGEPGGEHHASDALTRHGFLRRGSAGARATGEREQLGDDAHGHLLGSVGADVEAKLDLQLAGLDLRQVEDLVDEVEQASAAGVDGRGVLNFLGVQVALAFSERRRARMSTLWVRDEQLGLAPAPSGFPLRSAMYFPLASEGSVVGLTYLASYRPRAFSHHDERVLAALASHASGAYRRLESSVHRLRLSPRQSQVLALIASGLSDKEVAARLGLAHRTVPMWTGCCGSTACAAGRRRWRRGCAGSRADDFR